MGTEIRHIGADVSLMSAGIEHWLRTPANPVHLYDFLGLALLEPDRARLTAAVAAAQRTAMLHQNHNERAIVARAIYLLGELGRVKGIIDDPGQFAAYNTDLIEKLGREYAEGYGSNAAAWDTATLRRWLTDRGLSPSADFDAVRRAMSLAAGGPAPPKRAARVFQDAPPPDDHPPAKPSTTTAPPREPAAKPPALAPRRTSSRQPAPAPPTSRRARVLAVGGAAAVALGAAAWSLTPVSKPAPAEPTPVVTQPPAAPTPAPLAELQEALGRRDFDRAVVVYDTARAAAPAADVAPLAVELARAYRDRGAGLVREGSLRRALDDFDRAIGLNRNDASAYVARAEVRNLLDQPLRAIEDCNAALDLQKSNAAAYRHRGEAHSSLYDFERAVEDLTIALKLDETDAVARLLRASCLDWRGEEDQARREWRDAIAAIKPVDALTYIARARAHAQLEDYDRAFADSLEAQRIAPRSAVVLVNLAYCYKAKDDLDRALAAANEAIKLDGLDSGARVARSSIYFAQNNLDPALADANEAVRLDPASPSAHSWLAHVLTRRNDYDRAIITCAEAVRCNPKYPWAYRNRALAHLGNKSYAAAIADFTAALPLTRKASQPAIRGERGEAYFMRREYASALADLDVAVQAKPQDASFRYYRGLTKEAQGDASATEDLTRAYEGDFEYALAYARRSPPQPDQLAQTVADCTAAIERNPRATWAYYFRGVARQRQGQAGPALDDLNKVVEACAGKTWPLLADLYFARGLAHKAAGNRDAALQDLEACLKRDPKTADAAEASAENGSLYLAKADASRAIAAFDKALALNPNAVVALSGRAEARRRAGNHDGAVEDLSKALALDPGRATEYYSRRGRANVARKAYDAAISDFGQLLAQKVDDPDLWMDRGEVFLTKGDRDAANRDFDKALKLNPRSARVHACFGNVYADQEQYEKAVTSYTVSLKYKEDAAVYAARGSANFDLGRHGPALHDLDRAIQLGVTRAEHFTLRGRIRYQLQNTAGAIEDLTEAIRLDPRDAAPYNLRGNALCRQDKYDRAITDYTAALQRAPNNAIFLNNRADASRLAGDTKSALDDVKAAIALKSQLADSLFIRALIYRDLGRKSDERSSHRQAMDLNPDSPYRYNLQGN